MKFILEMPLQFSLSEYCPRFWVANYIVLLLQWNWLVKNPALFYVTTAFISFSTFRYIVFYRYTVSLLGERDCCWGREIGGKRTAQTEKALHAGLRATDTPHWHPPLRKDFNWTEFFCNTRFRSKSRVKSYDLTGWACNLQADQPSQWKLNVPGSPLQNMLVKTSKQHIANFVMAAATMLPKLLLMFLECKLGYWFNLKCVWKFFLKKKLFLDFVVDWKCTFSFVFLFHIVRFSMKTTTSIGISADETVSYCWKCGQQAVLDCAELSQQYIMSPAFFLVLF